jgi:hypothetical protein
MHDKHILRFFTDLFGSVTSSDVVYFTEALKSANDAQAHPSKVIDFLKQYDPNKPLFFSPNLFQKGTIKEFGRKRLDHNIRAVTCLFWDFDTVRIDQKYLDERGFPIPTYWFRRGDRSHIYYIFNEPIYITNSIEPTAKKITRLLKYGQKILGADPMPTHLGSVMRAPGTIHVKKGVKSPGYEMPIRENAFRKYHIDDFNFILAAAGGEAAKSVKQSKHADGLTDSEIRTLLLDSQNIITAGTGRSNALFRFGIRCRDWGLEEAQALKVGAEFNQAFCKPPEDSEIVEHQIKSAYKYASGPAGKLLSKKTDVAIEEFRLDLHVGHSLKDWVYVQENATLHHLKKPITYQSDQIGTALSYLTGLPIKIGYVVGNRLIQICDKMSFRPDIKTRVWEDESRVAYFNSFAGLKTIKPSGNKSYVKIFCDHLRYLTRTEEEAEHLIKYLAVSLCRPHIKIKHAVLLVSPYQGTGKSSLEKLFRTVLQSPTGHSYVSQGDNSAIKHGYNEFIDSNLITFFHEIGQDKYAAMDNIKQWITEEKIRINGKFAKNYQTDNYTNFILSTNNINALPIDSYDRKFFIVECREKPKPAEYYVKLHEAFTKGAGDILEYLHTRKDELDVQVHAPMTDSKILMQAQSKSEVNILLDDLYESEEAFFKDPFTKKSLMDLAFMAAPVSVRNSITSKAISRWLLARGFQYKQKRNGEHKGWKYYASTQDGQDTNEKSGAA